MRAKDRKAAYVDVYDRCSAGWLPLQKSDRLRGRHDRHEATSQIKPTVSGTISTLTLLKIFLTLVIFTMLNPALCQVYPSSLLRSCCVCVVASDKLLYDIFNKPRTSNRRNCMDVYNSPSDRREIPTAEPCNASSSFR